MIFKYKSTMTKKKAFTLIELLIVIAIIGILFIVLVSKVDFATDKAKASGVQTDFRSFQMAFETVSKENAGFNTFGWDTGDNGAGVAAGGSVTINGKSYTYDNANKDAGDRIRNSYDEGDINLNGTYDDGEVWTGRKIYTETWTGCYTLINPGNASDMSAIFDLEIAINKNLDPKLHIVIADDGDISMANGYKDPWSTQYHGRYITNASADAAAKWNTDASMAGSTGDNMDRGAILMYSNGANQKFGTKVKIVGGVVTATVSQIDADYPDNNKMGADDYVLAIVYTYTNGYGETAAITSGFSNNQVFFTGNGGNINNTMNGDNNVGTDEPDDTVDLIAKEAGLYNDTGFTPWIELISNNIIQIHGSEIVGSNADLLIGELVISDEITSLKGYAFKQCTSLTSVVIPDSVINLGWGVFQDCTGLTKAIIGNGISKISNSLFNGCTQLIDIKMSDNVTTIGDSAFYKCSSLVNIVIPESVVKIDSQVFRDCVSLHSIQIPNGVNKINSYTFSGCTNLTYIELPDGILTIGDYAFSQCGKLQNFVMPSRVINIGRNAFQYCRTLTMINIPNNVTNIGIFAFLGCTQIKSIEIPSSVVSIENGAFRDCSGMTTFIFAENSQCTTIGECVFQYCNNLEKIDIPASVTSIGEMAFVRCTKLANINVNSANAVYQSIDGNLYSKDGQILIQYAIGKTNPTFDIPNQVVYIGDWAFYWCENLVNVNIPNSVETIGNRAFMYCGNIVNVIIPDSVVTIGEYSFSDCQDLSSITFGTGLTTIGNYAFADSWYLKQVVIPDNVANIGKGVFEGSRQLTTVTIGNGVASLGENIFKGCDRMTVLNVAWEEGKFNGAPWGADNAQVYYNYNQ